MSTPRPRRALPPFSRSACGARPTAPIRRGVIAIAISLSALSGCGSPNVASIGVRKQNQDLRDQIETLTRTHEADQATIKGLQERVGTLPTLPQDRLEKLFTTHAIDLGRLTGGLDLDPAKPGDEGLRVDVTPTDGDGQKLKAAGSFTVEAFDLAANPTRLGKWTFDVEAARKSWVGALMSYHYVLKCPWQQAAPAHEDVTVKVTFRDELTGRLFEAQRVVKVKLGSATSPATTRATKQ
jgi:hypothetical protein